MSIIKYLQTPFHFNAALMQAEAAQLAATNWLEHYNKKHYEGGWSILPLRALNGDASLPYSTHTTVMPYANTPLLAQCPYFQEVINTLPGKKTSARLMNLEAGALIKEHTDQDISFEQGEARFHIPVQTNDALEFYVEDERIIMPEGSCWYLNLQLRHRVHNAGVTNRIHLVVDCLVDDGVTALFNSPDVTVKRIIDAPTPVKPDMAQQQAVIASLRLQNTETAHRLADEMEAALNG